MTSCFEGNFFDIDFFETRFWFLKQEEEMMRMMPYVYNGNFHHLLNTNNAEFADEANDSFQR